MQTLLASGVVGSAVLFCLAWTISRRRRGLSNSGTGLRVIAVLAVAVLAIASPVLLTRSEASASSRPSEAGQRTPTPALTPARSTASWSPKEVGSGAGYRHIARLQIPSFPTALRQAAVGSTTPLPAHGLVGSVVIPAVRSHFVARPAIMYLPPAARVPQPRLLPVIVAFSGQSKGAGPQDLVWSGDLLRMMDRIAAAHHGVAPIVVVPDQLGPATGNPMCVDSRQLGHSATYVMQDVRSWILDHLPVATDRRQWTVAGFSQGGTCAIQFAAAHPDVFGSFVDVSGEAAPINGTLQHTIAVGFGGDERAYLHATPAWMLAHRHYDDEQAYFASGALDRRYGQVQPWIAARASAAGMTTHRLVIPGMAHNWRTAVIGLRWGFEHLVDRWGI